MFPTFLLFGSKARKIRRQEQEIEVLNRRLRCKPSGRDMVCKYAKIVRKECVHEFREFARNPSNMKVRNTFFKCHHHFLGREPSEAKVDATVRALTGITDESGNK